MIAGIFFVLKTPFYAPIHYKKVSNSVSTKMENNYSPNMP